MNKPVSAVIGAFLGLIFGYPISYFFQAGALRAKLSLGDYILKIGEVFQNRDLAGTAIIGWIGSIVVFALFGVILNVILTSRQDNRP